MPRSSSIRWQASVDVRHQRTRISRQGKLPIAALFSTTPPDPAFADITPATTPANLTPVFALGFGAKLMQGYWASRVPPSMRLNVVDVDSTASAGDPYVSVKQDFALAKEVVAATSVAQGATDGGATAVAETYYTTLVPPFCLAAVQSFFAAQ